MRTLEQARLDKLLSKRELARRSGVSRLAIDRAEAGAPITPLTFVALCQALEVSREEITGANIYDFRKEA